AAVVALIYFELRVRKEGFDVALMAQRMGVSPPPGGYAPAPGAWTDPSVPWGTPPPAGTWQQTPAPGAWSPPPAGSWAPPPNVVPPVAAPPTPSWGDPLA